MYFFWRLILSVPGSYILGRTILGEKNHSLSLHYMLLFLLEFCFFFVENLSLDCRSYCRPKMADFNPFSLSPLSNKSF